MIRNVTRPRAGAHGTSIAARKPDRAADADVLAADGVGCDFVLADDVAVADAEPQAAVDHWRRVS